MAYWRSEVVIKHGKNQTVGKEYDNKVEGEEKEEQDDEEADLEELMEDRRVTYVYRQLQMLRQVCQHAQLRPLPIDHVLHGQRHLRPEIVTRHLLTLNPNAKPLEESDMDMRESSPALEPNEEAVPSYPWTSYATFFAIFLFIFACISALGNYIEHNIQKRPSSSRFSEL